MCVLKAGRKEKWMVYNWIMDLLHFPIFSTPRSCPDMESLQVWPLSKVSVLFSCMVGNSEALGSFGSELQSLSWEDLAESLGTLSLKLIITISSTLHWKQLSFYPWEWSLFLNPRTPGLLIPRLGIGVRIWDWSPKHLRSRIQTRDWVLYSGKSKAAFRTLGRSQNQTR